MRTYPVTAALTTAVVLAALLAGCRGSGSAVAAASSRESVIATSTAGQDAKALYAKCFPQDFTGQAKLGHRLLTDTKKHPNGSWAALLACAGVDPQNKPVIEDKALTAAEHVHWTDKTAVQAYFETTLPGIITAYANIPGTPASPSAAAS